MIMTIANDNELVVPSQLNIHDDIKREMALYVYYYSLTIVTT